MAPFAPLPPLIAVAGQREATGKGRLAARGCRRTTEHHPGNATRIASSR